MWFIGVEVEQETSAPPPKKNPGSAPATEGFDNPCNSPHLPFLLIKNSLYVVRRLILF